VSQCFKNCIFRDSYLKSATPNTQPITASKSSTTIDLTTRISDGKNILVPGADNEAKLFAAKAIAEGDNPKATQLLSDYLQKHPNDPEAQIYLNNLQSLDHNPLKIALVLSIDNLNIGQEMLRGAAQAQTEINKKGGINQRYLGLAE
jgi:branched-chain amino acid transport system substrate-binding protein